MRDFVDEFNVRMWAYEQAMIRSPPDLIAVADEIAKWVLSGDIPRREQMAQARMAQAAAETRER